MEYCKNKHKSAKSSVLFLVHPNTWILRPRWLSKLITDRGKESKYTKLHSAIAIPMSVYTYINKSLEDNKNKFKTHLFPNGLCCSLISVFVSIYKEVCLKDIKYRVIWSRKNSVYKICWKNNCTIVRDSRCSDLSYDG